MSLTDDVVEWQRIVTDAHQVSTDLLVSATVPTMVFGVKVDFQSASCFRYPARLSA